MKQLIFAVETNKDVKSDEIYIISVLKNCYDLSNNDVKIQFVYMDGKTKYKKKKVVGEINSLVKENESGENIVIYCFDTDRIDNNVQEKSFLDNALSYCKMNKYKLIWFCYDIEYVFLGRTVKDNEKKKESIKYAKKKIEFDNKFILKLSSKTQTEHKSNILLVLNKYLTPKDSISKNRK